jgi:hypothetical protein
MSPNALVGDYGRRPVVLTASRDRSNIPEMRQNNADEGRLVPLDVNSPDARLIAAAPALREALGWMLAEFGVGTASKSCLDPKCHEDDCDKVKAIRAARVALAFANGD